MQSHSRIAHSRIAPVPLAVAAALLFATTFAIGSAPPQPSPSTTASCVFSNPAFAGKCTQTTDVGSGSSEKQACESILRCLNDIRCIKTYCQATTIRTGWRLESATKAAPRR